MSKKLKEAKKDYTVKLHREYLKILQEGLSSLEDFNNDISKAQENSQKAMDFLIKEIFGIENVDNLKQSEYSAYTEKISEMRDPQ